MLLFLALGILIFQQFVVSLDPQLLHSSLSSPVHKTSISSYLQTQTSTSTSTGSDFLVLEKNDINLDQLNSLNLKDLKSFKVESDNIIIPNNFRPVFLFNKETNISFSFDGGVNITEYLLNSPPFNIPRVKTYELRLLVPKDENADIASRSNIPFVNEGVPLLVFNFDQEEKTNSVDAQQGHKLRNILEFDKLSKSWLTDLSIDQLIEGFFCNLNDEICLKIDLETAKIKIFSIWEQREMVLPLNVLLNDESIPRSKSYKQLMSSFKSLRNPTNLMKRSKHFESNNNSIEDLRFKLEQRLRQKKLKEERRINVKSKLSKTDPDTQNLKYSNIRAIKAPGSKESTMEYINFNTFDKQKEEVEKYKNQRSANTINKIKLVSTRVDKEPKELIHAEQNEQKKGCEPVTWYNVFHHSIFKDVEFCL